MSRYPSRLLVSFSQIWNLLSALWSDTGSGLEPNGATSDTGSWLDPNG